jgi:hypothetical protein
MALSSIHDIGGADIDHGVMRESNVVPLPARPVRELDHHPR